MRSNFKLFIVVLSTFIAVHTKATSHVEYSCMNEFMQLQRTFGSLSAAKDIQYSIDHLVFSLEEKNNANFLYDLLVSDFEIEQRKIEKTKISKIVSYRNTTYVIAKKTYHQCHNYYASNEISYEEIEGMFDEELVSSIKKFKTTELKLLFDLD